MSSYLAAHGLNFFDVMLLERIERQEGMVEFTEVTAYGCDPKGDRYVMKQWLEDVR